MKRLDLRSEGGFTMIAVLVVMTVATALATGALLAAQQDLPFSKASSDRKQAYAAAEAGVEYYLYQLTNDNDYWTKCTNVPAPAPVNNKWTGTGTRKWRPLAGTNARYTIELLPPAGKTCTEGLAETTMLDQSTGTIKIRATGQSGETSPTSICTPESACTTRSIVGEFRRDGFLDYIYFTDFETLSPEAYVDPADQVWARTNCNKYRPFRSGSCTRIQFASGDFNRGPFHTNDDILACGGFTLGRNTADEIEISGPGRWQNPGGGGSCNSGAPNVQGTLDFPAKLLDMPTTNTTLQDNAGVTYTGRTTLYLHDGVVDVTNSAGVTAVNQALPTNGVIYVENSPTLGCSTTLSPLRQTYNEAASCANVTVYGTYSKSLTIGSEKDIIVGVPVAPGGNPLRSTGDLVRSGDVVLGLIADKFVRVSHAVNRSSGCTNRTAPDGKWMNDITIQAAILSLGHSFIVDNYDCGQDMGTLSVDGAIAQRYRGPVGTGGSSSGTGYIKDYEYDDRLRYRSPPFFVNPVDAAWDVIRQNEQVPAAK